MKYKGSKSKIPTANEIRRLNNCDYIIRSRIQDKKTFIQIGEDTGVCYNTAKRKFEECIYKLWIKFNALSQLSDNSGKNSPCNK